jgi:hypothetical protein
VPQKQTHTQTFLGLFRQLFELPGVQQQQASEHLAARNALLCDRLLGLVHAHVGRAMLARHHLPLALHLARHLMPQQFPTDEWAVLLACSGAAAAAGSASNTAAAAPAQPQSAAAGRGGSSAALPTWVGPERAAAYSQVADSLPELAAAAQLHDSRIWAPWIAAAPGGVGSGSAGGGRGTAAAVPAAVASKLTELQQLILVAAFQPER